MSHSLPYCKTIVIGFVNSIETKKRGNFSVTRPAQRGSSMPSNVERATLEAHADVYSLPLPEKRERSAYKHPNRHPSLLCSLTLV